jgi:hypothetical protein
MGRGRGGGNKWTRTQKLNICLVFISIHKIKLGVFLLTFDSVHFVSSFAI